MALMSKTPAPVLDEQRVTTLRNEIDAFIDRRVQDLKHGRNGLPPAEGVPEFVLRNILMARSSCLCDAFIRITQSDLGQ